MELRLTPVKYRIMGAIMDSLISFFAILLILILTSTTDIITIINNGTATSISIINVIGAGLLIEIFLIFYLVVIPLMNKGSTIGQRMFHMTMVKEDGTDVDFKTLFVRQVVGNTIILVSTLSVGWIVSLIVMLYRRDNATIADLVGKTYVIDRD